MKFKKWLVEVTSNEIVYRDTEATLHINAFLPNAAGQKRDIQARENYGSVELIYM